MDDTDEKNRTYRTNVTERSRVKPLVRNLFQIYAIILYIQINMHCDIKIYLVKNIDNKYKCQQIVYFFSFI